MTADSLLSDDVNRKGLLFFLVIDICFYYCAFNMVNPCGLDPSLNVGKTDSHCEINALFIKFIILLKLLVQLKK